MTQIAELQKKYPNVPKDIIIKWSVLANGLKDSKDLDKLSYWVRASSGGYQSYDEDLTLKRMKEQTPWRIKDNQVLRPHYLAMKSGLGVPTQRKDRSPYTIREISDGKFALFEDEEMVDVDLYPAPRSGNQVSKRLESLVTSKGTPVNDLVSLRPSGHCYLLHPVRHCEYFNTGEQCRYCNYNPTQEDARSAGLSRSTTINPDEAAEAFKIIGSEIRFFEGCLESGGFAKSEGVASVYVRFVDKLCNSIPYRTHMKIVCEAMPRQELLRLKDAGLSGLMLTMETF
ncbi:MAG: hypothetical protein Q7O66_05725, partial [Dehalococcoidia bacterium]|nr:hypothetical protein [Dehalococcoidia bacterium]